MAFIANNVGTPLYVSRCLHYAGASRKPRLTIRLSLVLVIVTGLLPGTTALADSTRIALEDLRQDMVEAIVSNEARVESAQYVVILELYPQGLDPTKAVRASSKTFTVGPLKSERVRFRTVKLIAGDVRQIPFKLELHSDTALVDTVEHVPKPKVSLRSPRIMTDRSTVEVMVRNKGFAPAKDCELRLTVTRIHGDPVGLDDYVTLKALNPIPARDSNNERLMAPPELPVGISLKNTSGYLTITCDGTRAGPEPYR